MVKYKLSLKQAQKLKPQENVASVLLGKRQIKHVDTFLHPKLSLIQDDLHLSSQDQIHDMQKGTQLIRKAIKNQWKIVIYSDYDTDGITSNSIMYSLLKRLGAKHVLPYCPDRVKDGYGLNMLESKKIVKQHVQLVITTDNGISCIQEVKYLRDHNIDVIITDHHGWQEDKNGDVIKNTIPRANAIIMPNCPYDTFHFNDFCGGGIAFMIACYMFHRVATEYLDLACLATVADSVSLLQENRVIVKYGLQSIHHSSRPGLLSLAEVYNRDRSINHAKQYLSTLSAKDLSFSIIPRLNALGRIGNANIGRKLLLAKY